MSTISFSMINNQTFQLNVAVKTAIIGDNHEGSKKENKLTGYSKNFDLPSPAMISLLVKDFSVFFICLVY